jgi:hypothetical protein
MTAAAPQMVRRSYAYRIYPTSWQQGELDRQLQLCCDLYVAAREQRMRVWRDLLLKPEGSVIAADRGRL